MRMRFCRLWPRSCDRAGHNLKRRGERVRLRGDRRDPDGRSSLVVAAPSFLGPLLLAAFTLPASPLSAQRPQPELRVAVLSSSTLIEDLLAVPALKTRFPRLGAAPTARAAISPEFSVGASVPLKQSVRLAGLVGWQPTTLRAEDVGGEREVQDLSVLHALLEVQFSIRGAPIFISSGVGMLAYRGGGEGLFADGADLAPLVRLGVGGQWAVAGQQVTVRALGDVHRFGTPLIRAAGGSSGGVLRYGIQVGVLPGAAR